MRRHRSRTFQACASGPDGGGDEARFAAVKQRLKEGYKEVTDAKEKRRIRSSTCRERRRRDVLVVPRTEARSSVSSAIF
jgi:hypothetical protein